MAGREARDPRVGGWAGVRQVGGIWYGDSDRQVVDAEPQGVGKGGPTAILARPGGQGVRGQQSWKAVIIYFGT